jgi:hypothetical protein
MRRRYFGVEHRDSFLPYAEASTASEPRSMTFPSLRWPGIRFESWALRGLLILCGTVICYTVRPFHLGAAASAGVGVVMTVVIVLAELRLRWAAVGGGKRVTGRDVGRVAGNDCGRAGDYGHFADG